MWTGLHIIYHYFSKIKIGHYSKAVCPRNNVYIENLRRFCAQSFPLECCRVLKKHSVGFRSNTLTYVIYVHIRNTYVRNTQCTRRGQLRPATYNVFFNFITLIRKMLRIKSADFNELCLCC
jgi:hypothetical protein